MSPLRLLVCLNGRFTGVMRLVVEFVGQDRGYVVYQNITVLFFFTKVASAKCLGNFKVNCLRNHTELVSS